jgi:hypothetical protein
MSKDTPTTCQYTYVQLCSQQMCKFLVNRPCIYVAAIWWTHDFQFSRAAKRAAVQDGVFLSRAASCWCGVEVMSMEAAASLSRRDPPCGAHTSTIDLPSWSFSKIETAVPALISARSCDAPLASLRGDDEINQRQSYVSPKRERPAATNRSSRRPAGASVAPPRAIVSAARYQRPPRRMWRDSHGCAERSSRAHGGRARWCWLAAASILTYLSPSASWVFARTVWR